MRIATYNIAHGADYTRYGEVDESILPVDLKKLADVVRSLGADVIALNEVYERGWDEVTCHQTEKLAAMLGYPYYRFAAGADLGFCVIGNAVLSRYPIEHAYTVPVLAPTEEERVPTENEWYEDRVILVCRLSVDGAGLTVASTHFGLNPQEQQRMLAGLAPVMEGEQPLVLLGDFNARPDSPMLLPLYARMTDAAAALQRAADTFSSLVPDRRIDYIFLSDALQPKSFETKSVICSDHLPIVCDIEIKQQ